MIIRKIITPFLILLYLSAVVGLGFYSCHCDHSGQLVLLTLDHCDCAHEAHDYNHDSYSCAKSNCTHVSECNDDDCCTVVYKYIDIDQENSSQQVRQPIATSFTLAAILPLIATIADNNSDVNDSFDFSKAPPESLKTPLIYHNCQLRL